MLNLCVLSLLMLTFCVELIDVDINACLLDLLPFFIKIFCNDEIRFNDVI